MTAYETIRVDDRGEGVAIVTLHRPDALNALNVELMTELARAFAALEADATVGCVVLTGSEKAFAAGADIKEMASRSYLEMYRTERIAGWDADAGIRKPVLAAEAGLSLSRVSRIVDMLESRKLVVRQPCPDDARAINAELTPAGLELAQAAQSTHLAAVRERFFDHLSEAEVATLATVFLRFAPDAASACARG